MSGGPETVHPGGTAGIVAAGAHQESAAGRDGDAAVSRRLVLQVLEGPAAAVNPLLQTIGEDQRHHKLVLLLRREIEGRNFADWKMGFVDVAAQAQALPGFCDYFKSHSSFLDLLGEPRTVERVVDGFRDGQWRQYIAAE